MSANPQPGAALTPQTQAAFDRISALVWRLEEHLARRRIENLDADIEKAGPSVQEEPAQRFASDWSLGPRTDSPAGLDPTRRKR